MRIISSGLVAALAAGVCCGTASASDINPLGFYIGAGVGQSNVRNNGYYSSNYYGFDNRDTAWQLTVGMRPISPFGVEYDYIDFGSPSGYSGSYYTNGNSNTTASALFAVGYLPLPVPYFDVYGKIGVARLESDATVFGPNAPYRQNFTNSDLAYGAGAQWKFANIAIRAEYERIRDNSGDPDLLDVGVTWTF